MITSLLSKLDQNNQWERRPGAADRVPFSSLWRTENPRWTRLPVRLNSFDPLLFIFCFLSTASCCTMLISISFRSASPWDQWRVSQLQSAEPWSQTMATTAAQSSIHCLFKMSWVCCASVCPQQETSLVWSRWGERFLRYVRKNVQTKTQISCFIDWLNHLLLLLLFFSLPEFILWACLLLNLKTCIGSVWKQTARKKKKKKKGCRLRTRGLYTHQNTFWTCVCRLVAPRGHGAALHLDVITILLTEWHHCCAYLAQHFISISFSFFFFLRKDCLAILDHNKLHQGNFCAAQPQAIWIVK